MKNLPDELLSYILIRLSDFRSVTRLRSVCHRWNSLIADPLFIRSFSDHQINFPPPCGFLFQKSVTNLFPDFKYRNYQLYMDEFLNRHWKPAKKVKMRILASFEDLLLLSSSGVQYFIHNPSAKRLIRLPEAPPNYRRDVDIGGFGLVMKRNSYRVVVFHEEDLNSYVALVYSSETLEWTRHVIFRRQLTNDESGDLSNPYNELLFDSDSVVCFNGVLYWKHTTDRFFQRILRFDPFKEVEGKDSSQLYLSGQLPQRDVEQFNLYNLSIGVSRGRLRICQMYVGKPAGTFEKLAPRGTYLEVWELLEEGEWQWRLVHGGVFDDLVRRSNYLAACFDPNDERFVLLCDDRRIFRYNMSSRSAEIVGKIPWRVSSFDDFSVFPIFKLPYPTPIN